MRWKKYILPICVVFALTASGGLRFAAPAWGQAASGPELQDATPGTALPEINPDIPRPTGVAKSTPSRSGTISLSPTSPPPTGSSRLVRDRSTMPQSPFSSGQRLPPRVATIGSTLPTAPTVAGGKPYSNYRRPSTYSPYMNLFRSGSNFGIVDNYYSLVRPMVEQRQLNYQAQQQIQSLRQANQAQSQSLRQLQEQGAARTRPGMNVPAAGFMQHGSYFQPR